MASQELSQPTRLHGADVNCPAGQQDGDLLADRNGVAGLRDVEVFPERQRQIVGFRQPSRMERKSQIVNAGCTDRGPLVRCGVGVFVGCGGAFTFTVTDCEFCVLPQ